MSEELTLKSSGTPALRGKIYPVYKDSGAEWLGALSGKQKQEPQINADERRLIASVHRKTGKTQIKRIFIHILTRGHHYRPRNPCSITMAPEEISRHNKYLFEI